MAHSIAELRPRTGRWTARETAAQPYWNPYAVGVLLGLVLLATYILYRNLPAALEHVR